MLFIVYPLIVVKTESFKKDYLFAFSMESIQKPKSEIIIGIVYRPDALYDSFILNIGNETFKARQKEDCTTYMNNCRVYGYLFATIMLEKDVKDYSILNGETLSELTNQDTIERRIQCIQMESDGIEAFEKSLKAVLNAENEKSMTL